MGKIIRKDHIKNEEVLQRVKRESNIRHNMRKGRLPGLVTSCIETAFKSMVLKDRWKQQGEEEEESSSYGMTLRKREDTLN
jgi:hypothetical protein